MLSGKKFLLAIFGSLYSMFFKKNLLFQLNVFKIPLFSCNLGRHIKAMAASWIGESFNPPKYGSADVS